MTSLMNKPTSEKSEEELEAAYQLYILSKTVNGRFCPTPDLAPHFHDENEEYQNFTYTEKSDENNTPPPKNDK